jgi:hypothetical protein
MSDEKDKPVSASGGTAEVALARMFAGSAQPTEADQAKGVGYGDQSNEGGSPHQSAAVDARSADAKRKREARWCADGTGAGMA